MHAQALEEHASHRSSPFTNRAPSVPHSQAPEPPMSPTPVASQDSPASTGSPLVVAARISQQVSTYSNFVEQDIPRESPGSRHESPMSTTSSLARSPVMLEAPVSAQLASHPSHSPFTGGQSGHTTREQTASPAMHHSVPSSSKKSKRSGEASARPAESGTSQWGSRGSSTGSSTTTPATSGFAQFSKPVPFGSSSSSQGGPQAPVWAPKQPAVPPSTSQANRDVQVTNYLRGVLREDPGWETYVEFKDSQPPVYDMLQKVVSYIDAKMERYVDTVPPSGNGDLADTKITQASFLSVLDVVS